MKLWFKIVLLNVTIVVSLGVLIGMAIRGTVIKSMRSELTRQGESISKNLSDRIADFILLDDFYKTQEAIEDVLDKEKDIEYIFVTDNKGYLFAHTFEKGYPPDLMRWNPMPVDKLLSIQLLDTEKGFVRDIGVRIFGSMNPELHVGIKEARINQTLSRIRNLIIILTIIVTIVGSVLSLSLSKLITRPLNTLVKFTHDMAKGEFGKNIEIKSRDEVGKLSQTFNNLSHELEAYRRKMEESYKQMLRTEKLTATGRLSAGLAHELKNPLTSLKILFHTLKNNPVLTQEDITITLLAVAQLDDLLTKFLRFTRSDEFNPSYIYINSIIQQVINLVQFQIKNQSINVSLELNRLPSVKADSAMIQQAIMNLVLNAIEAMPEGGTLAISSKAEDSHIFISVKNTGSGIPDDIKDKIFDPFFTTKGDGTGLGLFIVYNVINLHHGETSFESDGNGTTFNLKIPVST
ncbi:MAG: HAMP domain-containing protein [Nitrospirae bacterium]|nr:HAMP domain-containing protein [Nitrospirota bacterium]